MAEDTPRWTTAELAQRLGGTLRGCKDLIVTGLQSLEDACDEDLTFVAHVRHAKRWAQSKSHAAIVTRSIELVGFDPDSEAIIEVEDAELAMIDALAAFAPTYTRPQFGIHPSAIIGEDAIIGEGCRIGPNVVVGRNCRIGSDVTLHSGVCIYDNVSIGDDSELHSHVVIRDRCTIGRSVILHSGVAIGTDGFGYRPTPDGSGLVKVPHIGTVIIEDEVEIGANSCVDRGKFGATVIGAGTKIDNLVQIGHNCRIGRATVIAGMTGVAGSVTIGDGVLIGGHVGIKDHLTIGSGARIAGKSAVMKSVPAGETWAGAPADEAGKILRQTAALRKLPAVIAGLSRLGEPREPEAPTPPPLR